MGRFFYLKNVSIVTFFIYGCLGFSQFQSEIGWAMDSGQPWPPGSTAACPRVHVECLTEEKIQKECGSSAVACTSGTGPKETGCKIYINKDVCHTHGMVGGKAYSATDFKRMNQCTHLHPDRAFKHGLARFMEECATLRHEYIHIVDTTNYGPFAEGCTENLAQDYENFAFKRMFETYCPLKVTGDRLKQCVEDACYTIAGRITYNIWDECMCKAVKRKSPLAIDRAQCELCKKECRSSQIVWEQLPALCKIYASQGAAATSRATRCEMVEKGHGCVNNYHAITPTSGSHSIKLGPGPGTSGQ